MDGLATELDEQLETADFPVADFFFFTRRQTWLLSCAVINITYSNTASFFGCWLAPPSPVPTDQGLSRISPPPSTLPSPTYTWGRVSLATASGAG